MFQHYALSFYPAFLLVQIPKDEFFNGGHTILYTTNLGHRTFGSPSQSGQKKKVRHKTSPLGVADGARTRDTQDHNLVLYLLSYNHHSRHVGGTLQDITRNYGCKYSWYRSIAAACADSHAWFRGFATNNTRR